LSSAARELTAREFALRMTLPVRQAMASVRWLEGRVRNRPKLDELTPEKAALTDGDCVSQEILLVALRAHFPWLAVSVEEDTPSVEAFAENRSAETVVIDPIDGTSRYLLGDGLYAILVGLEREGCVEAALVAVPQLGFLARAVRGGGAEVSFADGEFVPARAKRRGTQLLVSHGLPPDVRARAHASLWKPVIAAGGAIGVAPLLEGCGGALRMTSDASGLSRRAWISALPTLEAGGCVETLVGRLPERYEPGVAGVVVGSSASEIAALRELLG
jgi:fructose-1,6-bisphosphatase/inositol monophosphatase family enzyme